MMPEPKCGRSRTTQTADCKFILELPEPEKGITFPQVLSVYAAKCIRHGSVKPAGEFHLYGL